MVADEGVNMHGDSIVKISSLLIEYTDLVRKVHDHMLKCHNAHRVLRDDREAALRGHLPRKETGPKMIAYRKPQSFASRAGKHVGDMLDLRSFQKSVQKNKRIEQVQ